MFYFTQSSESALILMYRNWSYLSVTGIDPCDKANCSPDKFCVVNEDNWSYTCLCNNCDKTKAEVCDTNGVTHLNLCAFNRLICLEKTNATKDHDGACAREYYSSCLFGIIDVKLHLNYGAKFQRQSMKVPWQRSVRLSAKMASKF